VLAIGVALFGMVTGFVANLFLMPRARRAPSEKSPSARLGEVEGATSALREKVGEMRTAL
jgi:hypothetical protein